MGTPEDQKNALENLASEIDIVPGILSAVASNDPKTVRRAKDKFGAKKVNEAMTKLKSSEVQAKIKEKGDKAHKKE